MSITHQISYSTSSTNSQPSLTGTDNETGNSEINTVQSFAASTTNGAVTLAFTAANLQSIYLLADRGGTLTTNGTGTADQQTITITGTPSGGTFPLCFGGQTTAVLFSASAANVLTALQALSSIGASNATCTGGPLPGTPVVVTFAAALATKFQTLLTTFSGSLTGGSSPTVTITHTTLGKPSNTIVLVAGTPLVWGISQGYASNPFTIDVTSAFFTCTSATQLKIRILSS